MARRVARSCPRCRRLQSQVAGLKTQLGSLKTRVTELEARLAKAGKDSRTSSKPPSSDIVKPPGSAPKQQGKKRRRGGQPGHKRHERPAFPPEEVDTTWDYSLDECPDCGGGLTDGDAAPRVIQQVELVEKPLRIEEHRGLPHWCPACERLHYAPLPAEVQKAGLAGPRLTALVGFLKGPCHMSFTTIRKFLRDVVGLRISRGQLARLVQKVSAGLEQPYDDLLAALPEEAFLNVDETGHKENGSRMWTWCFRALAFTLFKISPSRGSDVLIDVLGREFDGVLGCDYFGAYRKYMRLNENVALQFCLAHLIRDVKFLAEHPNRKNRRYGKRLLEHLRKLFSIIHRRDEYATEAGFRNALGRVRGDLVWDATMESPHTAEALNLEERFYQHTESYFRFITEPGIDPTNNLAEQAIRFVAVHRRLTQGTRGGAGQLWCQRMWTAVATCAQQGRSVFQFLAEAVAAHLSGARAPSLLALPAPDT